ncbi:MAG: hypothetical protein ACOC7P_00050 [Chloroflexota bacterium]
MDKITFVSSFLKRVYDEAGFSVNDNSLVIHNGVDVAGIKSSLQLYRNEDLRREISNNNMRDAEKFSWDNITDEYQTLYESLRP